MSDTTIIDPAREEARQSFTGSRLTDSQFEEAYNITGIINREIQKTGSFREKLTDYSHAFARSQKFDAMRGETILRDLYSARYGESMNQTREALMERMAQLEDRPDKTRVLDHARSMEGMIKAGPTMPFYQAFDIAGVTMAREFGISENAAKMLMKDSFEETEDRELYTWGKDLEDRFHRPVAEAERAARRTEKQENSRSYARGGPSR